MKDRARADRLGDVQGALALLEEAFHLLRRTPPSLLLILYVGSVPFVLYLLYFIADRTQTGKPGVGAAVGAGLLYLAMKIAQGRYSRGLRERLGPSEDRPSSWQHALVQIESQPWSLFVLPTSFVVGLPFGWVYAYYQSLAVTGDRRAARRHAASWPRQNHFLLALLALCGVLVFVNALALLLVLPGLLHALLGIQSAATSNPWGMLSTTTAAAATALTYLALAPLSRAAYALRCFYRDARTSGDDLRGELRELRRGLRLTAVVILASLVCVGGAHADGPALGTSPQDVAAGASRARELDRSLARVLARREFSWRLPTPPAEEEPGLLSRLAKPVFETTTRWVSQAVDGLRAVMDWLRRRLHVQPPDDSRTPGDFAWIGWTDALFAVAALAVLATTILLVRRWRQRRRARHSPAPSLEPASGLAELMADADDAAAAALPYERWLDAAAELLAQGDTRGAVRAAYLAALALLAHNRLVTPARFKSNRDYQRELSRRARDRPEVPELFSEAVSTFERVWYGRHEASAELATWSVAQVGRLRTHAGS